MTPLEEALEPTTSSERLDELAKSGDCMICQAVARNPNTSISTLTALFFNYPAEVLQNIVIPLLLLENPNFLYSLYRRNTWVFNYDNIPSFFREWALQTKEKHIYLRLAGSSKTDVETLEFLAKDNSYLVQFAIANNPNTPKELRLELFQKNPSLCLDTAKYHKASSDILELLVQDSSELIRIEVAKNKNTSSQSLKLLSHDKSEQVRLEVAKNVNNLTETFNLLSQDKSSKVVYQAIKNINIPIDVLEYFLENFAIHHLKHKRLRMLLIRNNRTPSHIIEKIFNKYPFKGMRRYVAKNINTPSYILEILSQNKYVKIRTMVAGNTNTPSHILEHLYSNREYQVRCRVANNLNTPNHILNLLASDEKSCVRAEVASNINASESILTKLAQDKSSIVLYKIVQHPVCNNRILDILIDNQNLDIRGRTYISNDPRTSEKHLDKLAKDTNMYIRRNVAQNPSASTATLNSLLQDEVNWIRDFASENPRNRVSNQTDKSYQH